MARDLAFSSPPPSFSSEFLFPADSPPKLLSEGCDSFCSNAKAIPTLLTAPYCFNPSSTSAFGRSVNPNPGASCATPTADRPFALVPNCSTRDGSTGSHERDEAPKPWCRKILSYFWSIESLLLVVVRFVYCMECTPMVGNATSSSFQEDAVERDTAPSPTPDSMVGTETAVGRTTAYRDRLLGNSPLSAKYFVVTLDGG
mmetsp:Transcript_28850/g.54545  ORF Transcript_28850/g.54545 Transcript_28850/m.54545 type:complete len:200 (+) Transcript_28850:1022-1621(+)